MLRFEEGVAPDRGGPPLGTWQASIPTQLSIEGTFPKTIIAQGLAAFQRNKVRSLNLRRNDIVATVADTETHTTTLTRDSSRLPLGMRCNCTCRYGYDCKHAVAALYTLIEMSSHDPEAGPPPIVPTPVPTNGHTNGAPNGKAAGNGEHPHNGATATLAPASHELLDLLTPHHESVVPRRRLWVVVGFDDRLGIFYARLCLDAPKLHGVARTHADLQQLYRTTRQANLTGEEWDRHDAALLSDASLGAMFGMPADYALARATSEQTKALTNNFAQLLLRLISHPRVRYDDHLGAHPEAMPTVKIALSPLRLRISGTRQDDGALDLSGSFVRPDGATLEMSSVRAIDGTPAWLFDGNTFSLHDGLFSLRIVDRLKAAGTVRIAADELPIFLERAHRFLDRDSAAALMVLSDEMSLQTLLRLRWQGDGITVEASIEDARSGANFRITPQDFNPLQRVDSGKKGVAPRYAYCEPAVAQGVRARLEAAGCRPAHDVYEQQAAQHPDETVQRYDETAWRVEPTDAAYQFGTETLPGWRADYQLDMDDTVRSLVEGPKVLQVSVTVDSDEKPAAKTAKQAKGAASLFGPIDWLEISVELLLDGQKLTPDDIKALWQSTGRYHRLSDGQFVDLSSFALLREATGGFGGGLERGGKTRLTAAQMLSVYDDLAKACGDAQLPAPLRDLREAVRGFSGIEEVDPPKHLDSILRPYQRRGLDFLAYLGRYAFGGILADDMGLGKTLQVLSYLERERQRRGSRPNLIVCPTSVTHTWIGEAARFTPDMKVCLLSAGAGREDIYEKAAEYDLLVTSYALGAARCRQPLQTRLPFGRARRSTADQESASQDLASHQIVGIRAAPRAHRHADRELGARSVVDHGFRHARPARQREPLPLSF